jgi:hypothetical protein
MTDAHVGEVLRPSRTGTDWMGGQREPAPDFEVDQRINW